MLIFILFALAITMAGISAFQHYRDSIKSDRQNELSGIAELKIGQITTWMTERKGDAQVLKGDPLFLDEADRWLLRGSPDDASKAKLAERLASIQRTYGGNGYSAISLFDDKLKLRLSTSANTTALQDNEKELLLESLRSGKILFSDMHRGLPGSGHDIAIAIAIDMVMPLYIHKNGKERSIGAVLFRTDPYSFLFPLIQHWPTPSPSAESLLVRREGGEVVFLNELRHNKGAALSMRLPLSRPKLPAAMALMGREGLVEGLDYRGVPVVGVLQKVTGTSWVMVSKIDKAEIYAPIDKLAGWITALIVVLIGAGGGVAFTWRERQRQHILNLQRQYASEAEKRLLGEALKQSGSAIAVGDRNNRFIYVNPAFSRLFGYSYEDALGKPVNELVGIEDSTSIHPSQVVSFTNQHGMFQTETTRRTKDGRIIPVLISHSAVRDEEGCIVNYIASFTDLTRHKQAEDELAKQKEFIRLIIDSDPNLIFAKDAEGRFLFANEAMAKGLGQTTESIVGKSNRDLVDSRKLAATYEQANREVIETGQQRVAIEAAEFTDGRKRWFRTIRKPLIQDDGSVSVLTIATDITDIKEAEISLQKFNRVLLMLGAYNATLVHIEEEQLLLTEICKLIVETGGYCMAWVGYAEHDPACSVRPVARYGFDEGYVDGADISWADTERGRGPTGSAIRTGMTQFNQGFLNNPQLAPWSEAAAARGYQSSIAIPLVCERRTCGVLTIYSTETDAFNTDEVKLLEELGANLSFGIVTLRARVERAQAVERLRQSEEHFRFLTERSTDMVYLMSVPSGRHEYVSPASIQLFGYTPEEFCDSPLLIRRVIHPDWRDYFETQWERLLAGDVSSNYEYQIIHKSGDTRWMNQRNSPIRSGDGSGTLIAILGVVTDVTERKLAEGNRMQLSEALKQTQEAVALADQNNRFVYVNPAYERLFGYSEEELVGKHVNEVMGGLDATVQPSQAFATSSEQGVFRGEVIRKTKDGRIVPVLLSAASIKNEYGQITGYVANMTDLSERKRAEEALQKQKEFMWHVLDTDPNLIFVKNAEGKFILVNQAMADACGRTVQEMIWKSNAEIYPDHPQEVAGFLAADREVIQDRREVVLTESAQLPDGRQRWYLTIKRPLIEDNGVVSVLGIAMDITEQRQSQIKLAESYKELQRLSSHLENALEDERTRIARELHDEMGATLAAMKMRVAWLASRLPAQMPHLVEEAGHISELVSDGIQTVRQIVHKLRPSPLEDVGLAAAIEDYVKKFRQHTGIECMLALPGQVLTLEQGQAATLFRILQESLSNVAKHAQASRVDIILTKRGKSLLLVVEDNGIGFELGRKEKSFGLLGIRERALMAGGKARISSEPGKGSRISISIPVAPGALKAG
ncbi:hypothetical protein FGKAn22_18290 [Ferrigenium kumadai]|uniref:PAS domain S-box protein n=1 Tax=Ferrigenium kumadai TaxID=1682490 RepID=A0AAN1T0X7_9PROT|nr:hypothetical protein FGKAn22_18290 [Ferrigenium kumadai]